LSGYKNQNELIVHELKTEVRDLEKKVCVLKNQNDEILLDNQNLEAETKDKSSKASQALSVEKKGKEAMVVSIQDLKRRLAKTSEERQEIRSTFQ
jgi:hypothetical protein